MGAHNGNQAVAFEMFSAGDSIRTIATALNVSHSTVKTYRGEWKKRVAKDFIGQRIVPDGVQVLRGKVHVRPDPETGRMVVVQAWPDCRPEDEENRWGEFVDSLVERVVPREPIVKTRKRKNKDRMLVVILPDLHIGERLWYLETGVKWDVQIALRKYRDAILKLINAHPECHTIQFKFLGDVTHADDNNNETPASKHKLSVDGRHMLTIDRMTDWLYGLVEYAAPRCKKVTIRFTWGNHDTKTLPMFARIMKGYFHKSKHVEVVVPYSEHQFHKFGVTGWMDTHGHKGKVDRKGRGVGKSWYGVFANTTVWRQTRYHEIHFGHYHDQNVYALTGCRAECFETPMPEGEYAVSECFLADRHAIHAIEYDRSMGEVARSSEKIIPDSPRG